MPRLSAPRAARSSPGQLHGRPAGWELEAARGVHDARYRGVAPSFGTLDLQDEHRMVVDMKIEFRGYPVSGSN